MTKNSPRSTHRPTGEVRIIGGKWRRRRIDFADVPGLRPTGDRIRETLFNWLMADVAGAYCLDCFSGSGILGIEALSRGANHTTFIEKDTGAAQCLRKNLTALAAADYDLVCMDALKWLEETQPKCPFDIIFIDPPFAAQLWQPVFEGLLRKNWLAENALIYVESPIETPLAFPKNCHQWRQKEAGKINYSVYIYTEK